MDADASDEEADAAVGGAAQDGATKKKKRRPKKKNAAGAQENADDVGGAPAGDQQAAAEAPEDAAAARAPAEAAEAADPEEEPANESGEEVGAGAEGAAPGKKKKKKAKKKEAEAAAAAPEPAAAPAAEVAEVEAEAGAEESEEEAEAGQDTPAAKKKRPKRKKKVAGGSRLVAGARALPDDEEFALWAKGALEATKNGTEGMTREERLRPAMHFWGFKYSGPLRPAFVSPQVKMPADWCLPDYALEPEGVSHSERRGVKEVPILEGKDLETMREACRYGREVLDIAGRFMRAGVTGDEIDRIVWQACVDRKVYPSPLNYYRFPKSVCVSPNEVICHGIPDCRPIEEGDIVNLDISVYHQGYHADLNETFFVGECDEDAHRVVRTAYCALHAASKLIRPGTFYRDLGNAIHAEAAKSNCAVVTTYCGHGVGQLFHGPPKVPHYRKNKAVGVMKPGHVFTVEPMINLGSNGGDNTWPDKWTAVTRDGKRSAQFEHTFLVTEQGLEVLTGRMNFDQTSVPTYDPAMFQL